MDFSNFHTLFENTNRHDNYVYIDDTSEIPKDIMMSMVEAASDPDNLKITRKWNGNQTDIFIDATEFSTFKDARKVSMIEAANTIIAKYSDDPENTKLHMVFHDQSVVKNALGSQNLGKDVNKNWAMQLINGCRHYGIQINYCKSNNNR